MSGSVGQQRGRRRDRTEKDIVKALRKAGIQVHLMSGRGLPDLLCYGRHIGWLPVEVKSKGGRLTDAQKNTRVLAPFPVVSSIEEALNLFGVRA